MGLTPPKTFKVLGFIGKQRVTILIDSGASLNFISVELVEELNLPILETEAYGVILGTKKLKKTQGVCRNVTLSLQGVEVVADFLSLALGSTDMILGIQWLATLGVTHINWKTHAMKFTLGKSQIVLQGDPSLQKTLISLNAIVRAIRHEGQGYWVEMQGMTTVEENMEQQLPKEV